MENEQITRLSEVFILRIWLEEQTLPGKTMAVRFLLLDTRTGQRKGFTNLAALQASLEKHILDIQTSVEKKIKLDKKE